FLETLTPESGSVRDDLCELTGLAEAVGRILGGQQQVTLLDQVAQGRAELLRLLVSGVLLLAFAGKRDSTLEEVIEVPAAGVHLAPCLQCRVQRDGALAQCLERVARLLVATERPVLP